MTKQLEDGLEVFDGQVVKGYTARLVGVFDIDQEVGLGLGTDDLVSFVVTARIGSSKLVRNTQTGEMQRANACKIEDVVSLDQSTARWVYSNIGALVHGVNDGLAVESNLSEDNEEPEDLGVLV